MTFVSSHLRCLRPLKLRLQIRSCQDFSQQDSPHLAKNLANAARKRTKYISVVLDGVANERNMASISRLCDACGVQDLHLIPRKLEDASESETLRRLDQKLKSPRFQRISANAERFLSLHLHGSIGECHEELERQKYRVFVSSLGDNAVSVEDLDLSEPIALVFGNELRGVSPETVALADGFFQVPMYGLVESFNVSVAVALSVSELVRRASLSVPRFYVNEDVQSMLIDEWNKRCALQSSSGKPKKDKSVTGFGSRFEEDVMRNGIFYKQGENIPLMDAFQLHPVRGVKLSRTVQKAKFGALYTYSIERLRIPLKKSVSGSASLLAAKATKWMLADLKSCFDAAVDFIVDAYELEHRDDSKIGASRIALHATFQALTHLCKRLEDSSLNEGHILEVLRGSSRSVLCEILAESVSLHATQWSEGIGSRSSSSSDQNVLQLALRVHHMSSQVACILEMRRSDDSPLTDTERRQLIAPRMSPYECMIAEIFSEKMALNDDHSSQDQQLEKALRYCVDAMFQDLNALQQAARHKTDLPSESFRPK